MVGQHPGTAWRRIDLKGRTPRDAVWIGADGVPGRDGAGLAERDLPIDFVGERSR